MKLTNVQLEILTDEIYDKLYKSKITDKFLAQITDEVHESDVIKELFSLKNSYIKLDQKIKELQSELRHISSRMIQLKTENGLQRVHLNTSIGSIGYGSFNYDVVDILKESKINKLIPTKKEIKAKIILKSISGSKDLISEVLSEY